MANRSVDGNICCELGVRSERKQANNFPRRLIAIPSPAGLVPQPVLHAKQLLRHLELMCAVPWGCTGETARANLIVARIARPDQYHQMCGRTQMITPTAPYDSTFEPLIPGALVLPQYPDWQVGQAVTTVVSPDGHTLLIITSGYNRIFQPLGAGYYGYGVNPDHTAFDYPNSKEYVFIYDISQGTPVQKQVVTIPNSYNGIVFDPTIDTTPTDTNFGKSTAFYVSSGSGDYPFESGGSNPPQSTTNFTNTGKDNVHVFTLSSDGTTWSEQQELVMSHGSGLGLNVAP